MPVLLVNVHWSIELLRPGCYAAKEVWVRNGDGTYTTAGMDLPCHLRLQHIDAVPKYGALFCSISACPCQDYCQAEANVVLLWTCLAF